MNIGLIFCKQQKTSSFWYKIHKMSSEASPEGAKSLTDEDRQRFRQLFEKLDVNKDGKIEVSELAKGLRAQKTVKESDIAGQAKEIISKADKNENAELDFAEFVEYMEEHEQKLRLAFSDLDRNQDGMIEPSEVRQALSRLGLNIDMEEAEKLTKRIDKDGSLHISWNEWRDFFRFSTSENLEDMIQFWRQSLMIDIGDSLTCPPEFTKKEKKSGMWWRHLVAGGMAGAVSRTCTAPLDRLKILLQVHGKSKNLGIVSGFQYMIKEGGIKSLWRGNGTNVIKIAPESAIKFAAYEQIKRLMKGGDTTNIGVAERFCAGACAGAFAQTVIYPMEVIKTRLAVGETGRYKGILDCGLKIYQQEGMKMLFKGYLPNVLGIVPYAGIDLTIYETLKQVYIRKNPNNPDPGVLTLLACGTMSSTCGQLASYPLALVRTKMQAGATAEAAAGFIPLATYIVKNEGFRGFYRGIAPNFMKVLPAVSISYVIYETTKKRLGIA